MNKKKNIFTIVCVLGISCTGVAGLFLNIFPIISSILIILGIIVTIIVYLQTEKKLESNKHSKKIIARMMSMQGLGSVYANEYFTQMFNDPKAKDPELIEKAFEVTPDDEGTISLYCVHKALELSFKEWQGLKKDGNFKKELQALKSFIEDKIIRFPRNDCLYSAQGIILDIEGEYNLARQAFKKSGTLTDTPFWRISVSTSFIKEGLYDDALEELKHAKAEGMKNINIHFGKVYQEKGDYKLSEKHFRDAIKYDSSPKGIMRTGGWKTQALEGISYSLYSQGKFIRSSLIRLRLGFYLFIKKCFIRGSIEIAEAVAKLSICIVLRISKILIPIYAKFPCSQIIARKFPPDRFEYLIGNQLLEKQHYKAASDLLKKVVEIQKKLNNPRMVIESSLNLGNCYLAQGVFLSEAERLYKESLRFSEELNYDLGKAMAHGMLREFYKLKKDNIKQREHETKHFEYLKKVNPEDIKRETSVIKIEK